ncbi:MAG: OmpA family protein [Chitinophagales bacterium]
MFHKSLLLFFILLIGSNLSHAQEQWASSVVKYSSQAGYKAYAAKQVLGPPNALQAGKNAVAWAAQGANTGIEYIVVEFDQPSKVKQIAIWENFNPGAIFQINLIDTDGREHQVYEQNKPEKVMQTARMFRHFIKLTSYDVKGLKLVLNTAEVFGLNQIDAIGISSSETPMNPRINNPKDKTFVGKPENLGYEVNSQSPDLLPLISVDGQTLYFARKNHPENTGPQLKDDIYVSYKNKKSLWTTARNIGPPLNDEYNNFVCAVNPDGTEVLISGKYDQGEGLYRTSLNNGTWSKPKKIYIESYVNKSPFVCYHVSPDMKYLVIAMEDQATYGDMDLYVSFLKSDGSYTKPKNLGPTINTAGTEPSIFLSADSKTIYFASDGHPGYGAYDMYMSRRLDNSWSRWSEPVNLGDQINSDDWDLYYTVPADGEYAYYSSAKNSYGESDLYRIKLPKDVRPEPVAILKPSYVNVNTNTPIANLEKKNQAIIVNDDSKLNLYEEIKGFYPVNESEDLSDELEEEDNFNSPTTSNNPTANTNADDQKMNDLLARLQELKNEQAKTDTELKKTDAAQPTTAKTTTSIKPTNSNYSSDLDDRLAALRSDMDRIESGKKPENVNADEEKKKQYNVKPATKTNDKLTAQEEAFQTQQQERLNNYDAQMDALENFKDQGRNGYVAPREQVRKTYDLREVDHEEYLSNHQTYKDQLKELAEQKAKAAYGTQPLTKYSLAKTSIDEDMKEALVASSMKSELSDLKEKQKQPTTYNPEVDAYRKKLEELKSQQKNPTLPTSGKRITQPEKSENETANSVDNAPKSVDPEVLAFQEKLEALKNKMNSLPSAKSEINGEKIETATAPTAHQEIQQQPESQVEQPASKGRIKKDKNIEATPEVVAINLPEAETNKEPELLEQPGNELSDIDNVIQAKEAEKESLNEDIDDLQRDTDAILAEKAMAEQQKAEAEAAKQALNEEKAQLESDKLAMEQQKKELQDVIAQLQQEKEQFLADQAKIESDKQKLEALKLQQYKQVKQLEDEIKQLEQQKGKVQSEVDLAKESAPKTATTTIIDKEIFLMPVEEGVTVEIRNVFFNANSAYVKPQSYKELDKVVAFLEVNSGIEIEIGGHTNGLCQDNFCIQLSEKRADSVREYLISKGINPKRIESKGYGKSVPIADNSTIEGRKKNQRVELKILKVN